LARDDGTVFEPDALVYRGEPLDPDAIAVPAPMIVVEVLSPRTKGIDTGIKRDGYFRLPSVMHYLIVDPKRRRIIHHRRAADDLIETRFAAGGMVDLDPPGLSLPLAALFDA
jgi:Uma2 family endonuclease